MLPVKSKYKIAKRLGNGVFEQTQTPKFALAEQRKRMERRRAPSDYGRQLLEKQRIRYTVGITEKQLSNYAQKAILEADPSTALHKMLEMRADSAIYRTGFASTRRAARQMVSHGHITVNGRRITTPSYQLKKGDVIGVREGSRKNALFASLSDKQERRSIPQWLAVDVNLLKAEVVGEPVYSTVETGLDYSTLFEFYSR
jgi:small subunit ribosomal protein S4